MLLKDTRAVHNCIKVLWDCIKHARDCVSNHGFFIKNIAMLKMSGSQRKLCSMDGGPKVSFLVRRFVAVGMWNLPLVWEDHAVCVDCCTFLDNMRENLLSLRFL